MQAEQREITKPGPLLDAHGRLNQRGWMRRPRLDTNLERVASSWLRRSRVKRWDYYGVWTRELFASATLSHLGYAGLAFFYVVDLVTGRHVEHTVIRLFGRGIRLPRNSDAGDAVYNGRRVRAAFCLAPGCRRLDVDDPRFDGGRGLRMKIDLACPPDRDSIVVATPMGGRCFYYNRKINGMPAAGSIVWGAREVHATPREAVGQLDWGRGRWPYRSHWIWASANGFLRDGRIVGLNLGGGFGDLSAATENALFVNGRIHKFGDVRIDFDPQDYRRPWRMTDDAGRLDVELRPATERIAHTNLGIICSEVHQLFGQYAGRVIADDGESIDLSGLPGFAEEHHARW